MAIETLTVEAEFTTLDLLLWRRFRSEVSGRVERTIALNPGICREVYLPVGTIVRVDIPVQPVTITRPTVRLWE